MVKIEQTKIAQLAVDATMELKRLGINIVGKRLDQLLNMARRAKQAACS
jgi:hypothetical protein